jgi:DNA replication protein DnaC
MNDQQFITRARQLQQYTPAPADPRPGGAAMVAGIINAAAAAADANADQATEYLDEATGLLRCKVCGGPRQTIITPPFEGAKPRTVRCWCNCPTAQDIAKQREKQVKMEQHRSVCFRGVEEMSGFTFDKDDHTGSAEIMQAARKYAEDFPQHLRDGMGLLYYGGVGTGKTFLAACIANAVLAQGYKVKMTNFATVADEMWAVTDKAAYIADLAKYPLLILDDLGVERKSEYMQEMVYKIVNARYVAGAPVIVTTNLTTDELTKTAEIGYLRTYDRLLEKCLPIKVDGRSRRRAGAADAWNNMRRQLGMEVPT